MAARETKILLIVGIVAVVFSWLLLGLLLLVVTPHFSDVIVSLGGRQSELPLLVSLGSQGRMVVMALVVLLQLIPLGLAWRGRKRGYWLLAIIVINYALIFFVTINIWSGLVSIIQKLSSP